MLEPVPEFVGSALQRFWKQVQIAAHLGDRRDHRHLGELDLEARDRDALQLGVIFLFGELGARARRVVTVGDEIEQLRDLRLGARQRVASPRELGLDRSVVVAERCRPIGAHFFEQARAARVVAHVTDHPRSDVSLGERARVAAALALLATATDVIRLRAGDDGHGLSADRADEQTRQRVAALRSIAARVGARDRSNALLRIVPSDRVDDAKLGAVAALPFVARTFDISTRAGLAIALPLAAVVDQHARIDLVAQHRAHGQVRPLAAARTRHAEGVEPFGDHALRGSLEVQLEDPAHDLGFGRVDLEPFASGAVASIDRAIAVHAPARRHAGVEQAAQSAPRALLELANVLVRHHALDRGEDRRGLGARVEAVEREQSRAPRFELAERDRRVDVVAADAGQVLGHDHVDATRAHLALQRLEARSRGRRAADCCVREHEIRRERSAASLDLRLAQPDLILDRARILLVSGVAGVHRYSFSSELQSWSLSHSR